MNIPKCNAIQKQKQKKTKQLSITRDILVLHFRTEAKASTLHMKSLKI